MSVPITIRRAEPGDFAAVQAIYAAPRAQAGTLQLPFPSLDLWRQRLQAVDPDSHVLLACAVVAAFAGAWLGNRLLNVENFAGFASLRLGWTGNLRSTFAAGYQHADYPRGIAVPDSFGLVGFDGIRAGAVASPPLSTVEPDFREAGAMLVDKLLRWYPPDHEVILYEAARLDGAGPVTMFFQMALLGSFISAGTGPSA